MLPVEMLITCEEPLVLARNCTTSPEHITSDKVLSHGLHVFDPIVHKCHFPATINWHPETTVYMQ